MTVESLTSQVKKLVTSEAITIASHLSSEVSTLKKKLDTLALPEPTYSQVLQNQSENPDLSNSSVSTSPTITPPQHFSESSRKFNVVIFGVPEQPKGTSRFTREQNDFKEAASAIANTESESNHTSSIRECRRLGKYNVSKTRPILVTLNSTADVSYILSHCHHLHSPISIKPDLSLQDRKAKAILLHERWKLIQSGIERKSIKLRNLVYLSTIDLMAKL